MRTKLLCLLLIAPSLGFTTPDLLPSYFQTFSLSTRSHWKKLRERQLIRQEWDSSCGAAALTTILNGFYGKKITEKQVTLSLLHLTDADRVRNRKGFSLLDLKRLVNILNYSGEGFGNMTLLDLVKEDLPAILPVRLNGLDHFVVFRGALQGKILISDPAFGNLSLSSDSLYKIWPSRIAFFIKDNTGSTLSSSPFKIKQEDILSASYRDIQNISLINHSSIPLRTFLIEKQ